MNLTCAQMDVLISFYIEGDLSTALKKQVEEHMKTCTTCRAKYDIIKSMLTDLKNSISTDEKSISGSVKTNIENPVTSQQYRLFKNNLSAYIDNELSSEESIKIKKFTINNTQARQDLEDSYHIRKLLNDSFHKTKAEARQDYSKTVMRQLELEEEANFRFNPAIKFLICFTVTVLILTSIVLMHLSV